MVVGIHFNPWIDFQIVGVSHMPRITLLVFIILAASSFSIVSGQGVPTGAGTPPGGSDKNLADDGIKKRSVELERVKQELEKAGATQVAPINKQLSAKFPQIKEDFEGLQISQAAIVKAYTTGKTIDYALIESSAEDVSKKAKRLDSNLFAIPVEGKIQSASDEKIKDKVEKPTSLPDLIVELDNAIGRFVSSKLFANLNVIEPDVASGTRTDLINIFHLSAKLAIEAKRLK